MTRIIGVCGSKPDISFMLNIDILEDKALQDWQGWRAVETVFSVGQGKTINAKLFLSHPLTGDNDETAFCFEVDSLEEVVLWCDEPRVVRSLLSE